MPSGNGGTVAPQPRVAPYIVFATANLGYAVVVEAALSFLGVGTPPDVPSWGGMLSITGQKYVEVSP
jgi:peptide/nickel transport system permease protein